MFKVGDKVRCIKPKSDNGPKYDLKADKIYTIRLDSAFAVYLEDFSGSFIANRFIKIEEQPPYNLIHHKIKQMEERFKNKKHYTITDEKKCQHPI